MIRTIRSALVPKLHELRYRPFRGRPPRKKTSLPEQPLVSLICVSNRPHQLRHIVDTWRSQIEVDTELVLVTNSDDYGQAVLQMVAEEVDLTIVQTDPSVSLGAALNRGIEASHGVVVAKIDDDDCYAASYVSSSLDLLRESGAGLVGKKAHYVYLAGSDQTILRFPKGRAKRVGRVAGGTLFAHRDVVQQVRFPDVNLGEDTAFARSVEQNGWAVCSGDPAGYLLCRRVSDDHTWHVDESKLVDAGELVGPGLQDRYWQ